MCFKFGDKIVRAVELIIVSPLAYNLIELKRSECFLRITKHTSFRVDNGLGFLK